MLKAVSQRKLLDLCGCVAIEYYVILLHQFLGLRLSTSFVSYFMQLVDNDTVSVPTCQGTMAE